MRMLVSKYGKIGWVGQYIQGVYSWTIFSLVADRWAYYWRGEACKGEGVAYNQHFYGVST